MKKAILIITGIITLTIISSFTYLKLVLPNVGEMPDTKNEAKKANLERGRYLAMHVAVCMDCHSTRDWKKYSGPMVPGTEGKGGEFFGPEMGFPGKFYSRNLTPAHLSNWTDGEIFRAVTSGVSKDGKSLFPVMPYLYYGKMSAQDVEDIIAYLRVLTPIENIIPPHEVDFPMNLIINTIPHKPTLIPLPKRSDTLAYGAYLVNMAGCVECHTPAKRGSIIAGKEFSGGREFNMPNGVLRSANITPDKQTGIGNWTAEEFVSVFKAFNDSANVQLLKPGQVNTIMPWTIYAGMDTADLRSIFTYLMSKKPIHNQVEHFGKTGGNMD